jgi:hypothetical protein
MHVSVLHVRVLQVSVLQGSVLNVGCVAGECGPAYERATTCM